MATASSSASSSGAAMRPLPPVPRPSGRTINRSVPVRPAGGARPGSGRKGSRRDQVLIITTAVLLVVALVIVGAIVAQYWFKNHSGTEAGSNGSGSRSTSEVTTMPDLVGLTTDQAKAKLPSNVKVDVVKANAPHGEKEGTVLSTDPAAGEKISDKVTLTVAGSATSSSTSGSTKTIYLADIKATEYVNTDVFDLNGKSYVHGFTKIFYRTESWSAEWNLGKHFNTVSGTIGITDNSDNSSATFTVEFYLDKELVQTETLAFGEFKDISLNGQDKLRLEIVVTRTDKKSGSASVGFGDFQLQGDSDKVPNLDDLNKGS